jgi:hypothetical protein
MSLVSTDSVFDVVDPHCVPALPGVVTYAMLHPCKAEVLRELGNASDDPERGVRREAVDARLVCCSTLLLLTPTIYLLCFLQGSMVRSRTLLALDPH